jgi:hypothetical protein
MIIIRNCFVAKPGMASKLAAQFKGAAEAAGMERWRVLTDMTGEFNRVVLEYEAASMSDFEAMMKRYETDQEFRAKMAGYTELYQTGHREILRVA